MSTRNDESRDLTNRIVAGYRVLHRLGRGGMSEVYLGFHENLRRHVALKVLRQDLVNSPDHLARFLQEARAAASLVHPNIVQVYDIGQFDNVHYIAQEYIAGSNLRAYIQRCGSVPLPEALSILLQTSAALQKAASIGIVHRDIKPENILLTSDGEVKVADFGLARAKGQETNLTEVGVTLGTPLYMSPEQIQGSSVDSRSDLYSLGVTAFHMLAGRPPFEGETALALALLHTQNEPPALESFRPDLPPALCKIIHRLLKKNPDDRFSSAGALLRELRDVAESLPGKWHGDQLLPLSNLIVEHDVDLTAQTMRLQSIMTSEANRQPKTWTRRLSMAGMFAVAMAMGFWAAASLPAPSIVPPPSTNMEGIPKKSSIKEQYFYAMTKDGVPEWQAVEKYFSPDIAESNRPYNCKAWLHLARRALKQKDIRIARESLEKIFQSSNVDPVIRVLAFIEMMDVELEAKQPAEAVARHREEAMRYFKSLSEPQKQLVEQNIPTHLKAYWEKSDAAT